MVNLSLPSNYQDPVPELDLLVIAAHPTAAESLAGGTLIRMAAAGHRTGVLDLSPGDMRLGGTMFEQATAAMAPLGLLWRGNLHFPDGRLENSLPGRMTVAGEIRRLRPRVVVLPHAASGDPDHAATAAMGEEACHLAVLGRLDPEAPAHRVSTVVFASLLADAAPSFVMDVTAEFERKLASLALYGGDLRDRVEVRARYFGGMIGVRYGEPFVARGPLRVSNLLTL